MTKLPRKVLCLDWDTRTLRLVVARLGAGQIALEDAHSHRIPNTVDVENPKALGEFIQQSLKRHHWHYARVIVDIPREKAVINRLTLPPTPDHEVAAAVRFQAMKELPFPLEGAVLDFVVMRRDERGLTTEVLLAAVPTEALEAVRSACEAAGLEPVRIGLRPYASLVSVSHLPALAGKRVLFVGVGPAMTEIDVMVGGQLAFARSASVSVPTSGDQTADESHLTTMADVADLQVSDEAVETAVRELAVEVTRTLQAYRATDPDATVDHIVIAGGTGLEPALLEAVDRRFGLPSILFDPTAALPVKPDDAVKLRSFSTALGLAWGLSRDGTLAIDFQNPKKPIPARAALKRRLRIGAIAAGIVLTVAVGVDATLYLRKSGEYNRHRRAAAALTEELRRYLKIENTVEEVADWQTEAVWPEHLLWMTENAVDPGKSMLVQQMSFDARQAKINLKKVLTSNSQVPDDFVTRLNAFTGPDGKRPYLAKQGALRSAGGFNQKFEKVIDVEIDLKALKEQVEQREAADKARKTKLKRL